MTELYAVPDPDRPWRFWADPGVAHPLKDKVVWELVKEFGRADEWHGDGNPEDAA